MFERYTEKARRVIFFARYEASQFGSPYIETEHLVLGLLREDKALTNRFLRSHASVESIRKQIEEHTVIREKVPTSVDLPLSNEGKRVLAYAAEEAERLGHKHIGTEHLLLGLLREEKSFAAELLKERGVKLATVREELARAPQPAEVRGALGPPAADELSRDLTQAAIEGELDPVVGRDQELNAVIEVLSSFRNGNPLLVGERGAGKTAIVEALAQRIAGGAVPPSLAEKRILVFDPRISPGSARMRPVSQEQSESAAKAAAGASDAILFVGELRSLLGRNSIFGSSLAGATLRYSPLHGAARCIATCTPGDYRECLRAAPWLEDSFRTVFVRPLSEADTLSVLQGRKQRYEKFHELTYSDDALQCAVESSGRYLPERALPGKALELLDAAASRAKLRQTSPPEEIAEVQKRIKFIMHRMDSAIANHEFEKARFYSDEEKKERENLRALREKYSFDDAASNVVSREDVEAAIARWSAYPFQP
ncbi:MAG: Clp protease N-terminal domain-containing protein [Terracidiphilus sp.]